MSDHPHRLTDDRITQVLRARSSDPDVSLLDNIVRTVAATPQHRRWLGLGPMRLSRRALLMVAMALLLATAGAFAIGSRLIRPPDEVPPVVAQIVDAVNGRDVGALRILLSADATVVLPQMSSDGRNEVAASDWKVSIENFVAVWVGGLAAWDMEADLGKCRVETTSTIRCAVTTRWHVFQVEIGEEWTFVFDAGELTRLEMARVDPNPTNRSLPLGYDDLRSWESWLEVTHPDQAAALVAGDNLIWNFYFRYHPSNADAIGASIEEYLGSPALSKAGIYTCSSAATSDAPVEAVELRADGTLTWITPGGYASEGIWSAQGDAGTIRISDEDDPFTIAGEQLLFGGVGGRVCTLVQRPGGLPGWCGTAGTGGPWPGPSATPRPVVTPDPHRLLCIAVENHSEVVMALTQSPRGGAVRIDACSGMQASQSGVSGPWSLEVGRADPNLNFDGPVLASFDSSQLTGDAPYLIEVVINADRTASIAQRASLPAFPTSDYC
jgi:hypothetical protein